MLDSHAWTILILDDQEADRYRYRRLIQRDQAATYRLLEAETADQARQIWQTTALDVLILDYSLPPTDGLQVLMEILAYPHDHEVACIMLTGVGNEQVAVEAMKHGAYDYVVKSTALDQTFVITLQKTIERVQLRRQIVAQQAALQATNQQLREALIIQARTEAQATCLAEIGMLLYRLQTDPASITGVLERIIQTLGQGWICFVALLDRDEQWLPELALASAPDCVTVGAQMMHAYASEPHVQGCLTRIILASDSLELVSTTTLFPVDGVSQLFALQSAHHCYGIFGIYQPAPLEPGTIEPQFLQEICLRLTNAFEHAALYRDAQTAIADREAFLSIASHELKNPLAGLLGRTQLLQRRMARSAPLAQMQADLTMILEQGNRLNTLLSELLDISRLTEGQLEIQRQPVDLGSLLDDVLIAMQAMTTRHHIVQVSAPGSMMVYGDARRLEQVLVNLLQNAVKYSPDGGTITVEATMYAHEVRIQIHDQGIGIPKTAMPHVFKRFYRVPSERMNMISGSGIGLYVVKEIVAAHGGSIEVESQEGIGSCFTICIPTMSSELPIA
ncbi:ATP-binding protein [Herpetosiphon sp. NSE202]|uniref:sensor histidine kinase n=1 Tax=Herpetosiphon sp. NSE202 TaxID=3351349 RepID=UPI00364444F0